MSEVACCHSYKEDKVFRSRLGYSFVAECLPNMHKTLRSIPRTRVGKILFANPFPFSKV